MFLKSLLLSLALLTSTSLIANDQKAIDLALNYGSEKKSSLQDFIKVAAYIQIIDTAKKLDCSAKDTYSVGVCSFIYTAKTKEDTIEAMHQVGVSLIEGKEKDKSACMFALMETAAGEFSALKIGDSFSSKSPVCDKLKNVMNVAKELQDNFKEVKNVDIH